MPFVNFTECARVLDPVRRWKQTVESRQLVNIVSQGPRVLVHFAMKRPVWGPIPARTPPGHEVRATGYWSHPAAVQWRGYADALREYSNTMLLAVLAAGTHEVKAYQLYDLTGWVARKYPPWIGDERVHSSHRSRLLSKDPAFYGRYGWTDDPEAGYVWPKVEDYSVADDALLG